MSIKTQIETTLQCLIGHPFSHAMRNELAEELIIDP